MYAIFLQNTELIPNSGIFIDHSALIDIKDQTKNSHTCLARSLMNHVFTEEALKACSLRGSAAGRNNAETLPGLNKDAVRVI